MAKFIDEAALRKFYSNIIGKFVPKPGTSVSAGSVYTADGAGGGSYQPQSVTAEQIGLGNVDNTSDADKPVSTAMQSALNGKVDATLVKTVPSANNKILTEADSVDSPPEVHIGDAEPTGDEAVWYNPDEEDEDEPIDIASVDYVNEKVASKEDSSNKVTSISSSSTDDEYPSAKCMYDIVGDIESALAALIGG